MHRIYNFTYKKSSLYQKDISAADCQRHFEGLLKILKGYDSGVKTPGMTQAFHFDPPSSSKVEPEKISYNFSARLQFTGEDISGSLRTQQGKGSSLTTKLNLITNIGIACGLGFHLGDQEALGNIILGLTLATSMATTYKSQEENCKSIGLILLRKHSNRTEAFTTLLEKLQSYKL